VVAQVGLRPITGIGRSELGLAERSHGGGPTGHTPTRPPPTRQQDESAPADTIS
jgi:hypothetical protein